MSWAVTAATIRKRITTLVALQHRHPHSSTNQLAASAKDGCRFPRSRSRVCPKIALPPSTNEPMTTLAILNRPSIMTLVFVWLLVLSHSAEKADLKIIREKRICIEKLSIRMY